jgi:hypothetical protein
MTPKDVHVARDVHLADAASDALVYAFFSAGVLGVAQVLALGATANDPRDSELVNGFFTAGPVGVVRNALVA